MATNLKFMDLPLTIAVASGTSSGDPVMLGGMPGVALKDRDSSGNAPVDFRANVWDLSTKGIDDAGNVAVAAGDAIYYISTDTPVLSKKASGKFFGIAMEAVTSGATTTIEVKLKGIGAEDPGGMIKHAKALTAMDLSGAAVVDNVVLHVESARTLVNAVPLYTEASSTHTGVTLTLGKETDAAYYYTGASTASAAQWTGTPVTLLASDIAAGDTVICGSAGSKTGAGEVLWCIEYV